MSAPSDFQSVHLGDTRLNDRLLSVSEALQERPSEWHDPNLWSTRFDSHA